MMQGEGRSNATIQYKEWPTRSTSPHYAFKYVLEGHAIWNFCLSTAVHFKWASLNDFVLGCETLWEDPLTWILQKALMKSRKSAPNWSFEKILDNPYLVDKEVGDRAILGGRWKYVDVAWRNASLFIYKVVEVVGEEHGGFLQRMLRKRKV